MPKTEKTDILKQGKYVLAYIANEGKKVLVGVVFFSGMAIILTGIILMINKMMENDQTHEKAKDLEPKSVSISEAQRHDLHGYMLDNYVRNQKMRG